MSINPIRAIVVDDSMVFREILSRGIASDPGIEVVAQAVDPFDARDRILEHRPDVMICDVEMPRMNGIEFIRKLLPQYYIPVVVVSSANGAVFDALNAGAFDFVSKPNAQSAHSVEGFIREVILKVKAAVQVNASASKVLNVQAAPRGEMDLHRIVAIGSSTGGTDALYRLLQGLPYPMPGIVIAQHIPPVFSRMFAERLNQSTAHTVKEAQSGDYVEPGKVYIAPGEQHMRIRKVGEAYKVEVFSGAKVNGHSPSVDVLFDSVAKEAGNAAVGIILTGMGYDGAKGLLSMRRRGAVTLGQDEQTSVVYGMPKVAYEIGAVSKQVSLNTLPEVLCSILKRVNKTP